MENQYRDISYDLEKRKNYAKAALDKVKQQKKEIEEQERLLEKEYEYWEGAYQAEMRRLGKLPKMNQVQKPKESRFAGMRIADAAYRIFMESNKVVLTTREILSALSKSGFQINARFPTASINSALKREQDKFEKIGRGTFKLKEKLFK